MRNRTNATNSGRQPNNPKPQWFSQGQCASQVRVNLQITTSSFLVFLCTQQERSHRLKVGNSRGINALMGLDSGYTAQAGYRIFTAPTYNTKPCYSSSHWPIRR